MLWLIFLYGVAFEDNFRFILIDSEDVSKRSEAESQTDFITAYTFYQSPGMPFGYNYVLIDTPGFGDTRGIERDQEMAKQLEAFLKQDYGVDEVDAIGLVTPVSVARLTQFERYVYEGLSSLFGKDVKENVYIMATFADAKNPLVQEALKEAGISYAGIYKFNNSALFAQNREGDPTHKESYFDSEDSVHISKLFWEAGYRSLRNFFLKLSKTSPVSLRLTRNVLKERAHLQLVVSGLQEQIHNGLQKLGVLKQERIMLTQIIEDIKGSSNFQEEVKVTKIRKIDLKPGEHVSNCVECNFTCHYPCSKMMI
ncbi:uncharacterized protein [Macrobrachium rosenbergii]|uniref:uncharacterized protein n=1 Tax=Macrobrachium rosenbergii TaxID=79674 RepID=UPI0034D71111